MKYFKKYPIFFAVFSLLILLFVAGAGLNVWLAFQRTDAEKKLERSMRAYKRALKDDPTQVAIDASVANIDKLNERLVFLEHDLTRASADIFKVAAEPEGYQLVEQLRGLVNSWRKEASAADIKVGSDMDFGFKKYVEPNAEPPKTEAVESIWKQACVMDYINRKLFGCKSENSPMAILAVQREVLPAEVVKVDTKTQRRQRVATRVKDKTTGDNFQIESSITARKEGSLDTLAFRYVFTGHTDVLRKFLNKLKDFDAMLVVRSIDVKQADASQLASLEPQPEELPTDDAFGAIFGGGTSGGEQTSADASAGQTGAVSVQQDTPVVIDNISEFTVVIEYVEVVKDIPVSNTDKDADSAETK